MDTKHKTDTETYTDTAKAPATTVLDTGDDDDVVGLASPGLGTTTATSRTKAESMESSSDDTGSHGLGASLDDADASVLARESAATGSLCAHAPGCSDHSTHRQSMSSSDSDSDVSDSMQSHGMSTDESSAGNGDMDDDDDEDKDDGAGTEEDDDDDWKEVYETAARSEVDANFTPFDDDESMNAGFKVGVSEDRNKKYRRTMEDSHTIVYNFDDVDGSGFFAVFDGHAGRQTADYCGQNLHQNFARLLKENPDKPIPDLLNDTFIMTDEQLSQQPEKMSGCTAVVAYVRTEMRPCDRGGDDDATTRLRKRRVLYTANAGDARAVLCRNGTATRLSFDHKGSDQQETRRVLDAGGFVMNNRVNGVLAVTRSLGDLSMKEWVIGNPYTTETELDGTDAFLVLACDGLWDVCSDQQGTDLVKDILNPQEAAEKLLEYALENYTTDNLTVIVVRFNPQFLADKE